MKISGIRSAWHWKTSVTAPADLRRQRKRLNNLSALLRRGREAQREYPAMFVFDWMLPGMDGMAAIRKIREMPDFSAAPSHDGKGIVRWILYRDLTTVLTTT